MINRLLKKGSKGPEVIKVQQILKIKMNGYFNDVTERAVIDYQLSKGLKPDGIVGGMTWTALLTEKGEIFSDISQDTDLSSNYFVTDFNSKIHKYYLDKGQYLEYNSKNEYLFLHHTAGNDNPFKTIDYWNKDNRGRVATEFVIGGQNYRTGSDAFDGIVVQSFPETGYGWHLGKTGSGHMNKRSVGIELCSIGYLEGGVSWVGKKAIESQIINLTEPFRGKTQFHKYSDAQIEETEKLIKYIAERDGINIREGLQRFIHEKGAVKAFGFDKDAYYGKVKGLLSHGNVRKDKTDIYPDQRFIDMIMSL